ncbi:MAG: DUF2510 domain-containing protein [Acidimicrobiales bacterium]
MVDDAPADGTDEHGDARTVVPGGARRSVPRPETMTPTAPLNPGAGLRLYPTMPPPVSVVPAQWATDPSGRHQWRWWDGVAWTDQVADDGLASVDPLP